MRRGAIVLCGGESSRMGRDKASLPFGDETLLQRVVRLVAPVVDEVVVVARPGQSLPALPEDVRVTRDEVPGLGPLAGIAAGLSATTADAAFVTACDAPFLRPEVVSLLFDALGDAPAAAIEADGFLHPLAAVYRRVLEPVARSLLAEGRPRPLSLLERVPTVRLDASAVRAVDPALETLENLNTEEAYRAALERLGTVRIELYEIARRIAGVATVEVRGGTLGEALAALCARHPDLEGRVVEGGRLAPHWLASIDGIAFVDDPETPLPAGASVVIVSALTGG